MEIRSGSAARVTWAGPGYEASYVCNRTALTLPMAAQEEAS